MFAYNIQEEINGHRSGHWLQHFATNLIRGPIQQRSNRQKANLRLRPLQDYNFLKTRSERSKLTPSNFLFWRWSLPPVFTLVRLAHDVLLGVCLLHQVCWENLTERNSNHLGNLCILKIFIHYPKILQSSNYIPGSSYTKHEQDHVQLLYDTDITSWTLTWIQIECYVRSRSNRYIPRSQ